MTVEFKCGDPAGLAGYLYDECDAAERAAIEAHLADCPSCVSELASLGATRTALASWTPPDAKLGFRITPADEAVNEAPRWWQRPLPAWAQAAAAALIFAVGMGLGMRTAGQGSDPAAIATRTATATHASTVSPQDLAALESRLRAEMGALRAAAVAPARQHAQVPAGGDAILQRVRTLLAESEERQQRELAVRLGQVLRDVDSQRRMDLLRIQQTFGRMEGFTRPELANQRQMLDFLIKRTGAQQPQ